MFKTKKKDFLKYNKKIHNSKIICIDEATNPKDIVVGHYLN